jgi:hypothetical protein
VRSLWAAEGLPLSRVQRGVGVRPVLPHGTPPAKATRQATSRPGAGEVKTTRFILCMLAALLAIALLICAWLLVCDCLLLFTEPLP